MDIVINGNLALAECMQKNGYYFLPVLLSGKHPW